VAIILIIFVRINLPNFVQFTQQGQSIQTIQIHSGDQAHRSKAHP